MLVPAFSLSFMGVNVEFEIRIFNVTLDFFHKKMNQSVMKVNQVIFVNSI